MLEFRLDDWIIFKNIFTNINEIIDEIVIECNPEGLRFKALDRSHICFFECDMPKSSFGMYNIDNLLSLYVDVNELVNVLKRGNRKDSLIFRADNETFDIIFENENRRTFNLIQIDMSDNSREFPSMNYSVKFFCDYDDINNALKDADLYSDRLKLSCKDNSLVLSCDGSFGNYKNELVLDDYVSECSATYTISWLFKIFKTKLSSNKLEIHMGNNYPMLVVMNEDDIKLRYLLAPRIEQDDE